MAALKKEVPFYDRVKEAQQLREYLQQQPQGILVLLGGVSTGKTALLKNVLRDLDGVPISYINGRDAHILNPASLAAALSTGTRGFREAVPWLFQAAAEKLTTAGAALPVSLGGDIKIDVLKAFKAAMSVDDPDDLKVVIDAYKECIRAVNKQQDKGYPIIVIDEANLLELWGDEYQSSRKLLFAFFIKVAKEDNLAHVVLATSEWSFLDFMKAEMKAEFLEPNVIGNFPRDVAQDFFELCLEIKSPTFLQYCTLDDSVWNAAFEACGGHPPTLRKVAGNYTSTGDLTDAITSATLTISDDVEDIVLRGAADGLPTDKVMQVVSSICDSTYGGVLWATLDGKLGPGGHDIVRKLLRANLLGLRPSRSSWAQDVDVRAWGDKGYGRLITASSPMHLYHMRRILRSHPEAQPGPKDDASSLDNQRTAQTSLEDVKAAGSAALDSKQADVGCVLAYTLEDELPQDTTPRVIKMEFGGSKCVRLSRVNGDRRGGYLHFRAPELASNTLKEFEARAEASRTIGGRKATMRTVASDEALR